MTNTHVIMRLGVAALPRSGWQPSRELGGNLPVKRVATFSEIRISAPQRSPAGRYGFPSLLRVWIYIYRRR